MIPHVWQYPGTPCARDEVQVPLFTACCAEHRQAWEDAIRQTAYEEALEWAKEELGFFNIDEAMAAANQLDAVIAHVRATGTLPTEGK